MIVTNDMTIEVQASVALGVELDPVREEERSLLTRCATGETEPYGQLVERYQLRVFNLVLRMLGDRSAAEDITQEAFIRAYQRLALYDLSRRFLPWLMKIAANLARNYMKKKSRDARSVPLEWLSSLPAQGNDPEAETSQKEWLRRVETALFALSPSARTAILLKHQEGMSYEEMSEVMEEPVFILKMRVSRARKKMRTLLERNQAKEGGSPS